MTVDIKRLTAHLSQSQQEEITKAYEKQAENETAAFLWCFFLGWMGAHRFYLRQWGQGLIHLILALITIGIAVGGALANLDPTLVVLAALPFGLAALLWEIIDLFRIDDEVSGRNLRLAEKLIADTMLADTSVLQQAQTKLDEVLHHVAAESGQSTEAELVTTGLAAAAEPTLAGAGKSEPVVEAVPDTGTTK
jgi:TM2 domain-containing membrane protein YozV